MMYLTNNKVLTQQDQELFSGLLPTMIPEPKKEELQVAWKGAKIPHKLWQTCLAFLKWTYDKYKSEATMRLAYNRESRKWAAIVLPQEICGGLTAQEFDEHDNLEEAEEAVRKHGFTYMGTIHHHCGVSAFQSGTDLDDELTQGSGVHFTVGFLNRDHFDLDVRVVVAGFNYPHQKIEDWIDSSNKNRLDRHATFPRTWKKRMVKKKIKPMGFSHSQNSFYGWEDYDYDCYPANHLPYHYREKSSSSSKSWFMPKRKEKKITPIDHAEFQRRLFDLIKLFDFSSVTEVIVQILSNFDDEIDISPTMHGDCKVTDLLSDEWWIIRKSPDNIGIKIIEGGDKEGESQGEEKGNEFFCESQDTKEEKEICPLCRGSGTDDVNHGFCWYCEGTGYEP